MSRMDVYKLISEQCLKITKAEPTKGNKMNAPNRHAALMRQYMEDLILDPDAYKNWEFQYTYNPTPWATCGCHPKWASHLDYRRKAKTIMIGGMEVPEPMRVAPKVGEYYYMPLSYNPNFYGRSRWCDDHIDRAALKHGMCHTTLEAAEAHGKALIIASGGKMGE